MVLCKYILIFFQLFHVCRAYKHVVYMHGILAGPTEAKAFISMLVKAHPGTNVTVIDMFNDRDSLYPMWQQVHKFRALVEPVMRRHPEGVHLVCFSQGGLLCRGLLSVMKHNVHNFVSLSSPQAGQYGDTEYLKYFFPHFVKEEIYEYFYSFHGQKWSIANYWHDPHHEKLYREYSQYLGFLDNDTVHRTDIAEYKKNFLRIKNLILIGGSSDKVITPWQSSLFGFYDENEKVVNMTKQEFYLKDSFGLKTLDKRKAIHIYEVPGVDHIYWYRNQTVFDNCIKKWLD